MRDANGKIHMVYKSTNSINGRFYIGKHTTRILEDGYLGSGKRLQREIAKYGRHNFVREILFFATSSKNACLIEREIVNSDLLNDENCLNLKLGGDGGWPTQIPGYAAKFAAEMWQDPKKRKSRALSMSKSAMARFEKESERENRSTQQRKVMNDPVSGPKILAALNTGSAKWRLENPELFKEKQSKGTKGKIYVTNGKENKMIMGAEIPEGWYRGRTWVNGIPHTNKGKIPWNKGKKK